MRRSALVTGGSRGIGLALARTLVAEGYTVTICARDPGALTAAADSLQRDGGTVLTHAADLSQPAAARALIEAHRERFGRLDLLVNNVGTGFGAPVDEIVDKRLDLQLDLNLRAAILCYREAAELLLTAGAEHQEAWVVNMCSLVATYPQPWLSVYSATKAGLRAFSAAMNSELSGRGVRSCAICPGTIDTELSREIAGSSDLMVSSADVTEVLRLLLRLSPPSEITEIVMRSRFDREWRPPGV